jgi:hypothetical protein
MRPVIAIQSRYLRTHAIRLFSTHFSRLALFGQTDIIATPSQYALIWLKKIGDFLGVALPVFS